MQKNKSTMYNDARFIWNFFKGCKSECEYCKKSFMKQSKRQRKNCEFCYTYEPHIHLERLNKSLPKTNGDEFIWCGSSGDISFINKAKWDKEKAKEFGFKKKSDVMEFVLKRIRENPDKTFFFQTKNPSWFLNYDFPANVILGITLETNRDEYYKLISKATLPMLRYSDFCEVKHSRKSITIEPVMKFDLTIMMQLVRNINPERVYIGYDTKNTNLPEPELSKVEDLIEYMEWLGIKVKRKTIREGVVD